MRSSTIKSLFYISISIFLPFEKINLQIEQYCSLTLKNVFETYLKLQHYFLNCNIYAINYFLISENLFKNIKVYNLLIN